MDFSGTQDIAVPVQQVWTFLLDVNNVAACAPGFQSLEVLGDEHWKAIVSVGVGPVKAKFTMDVTRPISNEQEHHMVVKGRGKAPGSVVDLSGDMRLVAGNENETRMDWQADVVVSGTIASVGARLLRGTAERMTEKFFSEIKQKLQAPEVSQAEG